MTNHRIQFGIAATCLLTCLGSAQAAGGVSVTQKEARTIATGMSTDDVQRLIGKPFKNVKYRQDPGPVWTYYVTDAIDPVFFEISFSADGRVAGISQYVDPAAYTGK